MKVIARQVIPYFSKAALKPIGQVLGSQMLMKAMGFGIGIILVRELSKEDYAIYTVLITIQGMLIPLSNSSIFIGFKKIGGEVWNHDDKMSKLIKTANHVSYYIIGVAFLLVGSYATYILNEQNIQLSSIILFLICLLVIVIPDVHTSFLRSALLLQKKIATVQITEIIGQASRFIVVVCLLVIMKKNLTISIILLITVCSTWFSYLYIRTKSKKLRLANSKTDQNYQQVLTKYIKLNWHNSAFFAFKSQISIFLIGAFGTSESLADIGALTRFALIFSVATSIMNNIYAPAFGRCQSRKRLAVMFRKAIILVISISSVILLTVIVFPHSFLWILGVDYQHLSYELFLVFLAGSISLLLSTVYAVNLSKGWIKYTPTWEIPLDILAIISGVILFDISTISGVLYLSIFASVINLILHLSNSWFGLKVSLSK